MGVGIVEEPRARADLLDVAGKVLQNGNGAQRAHDAADSERIRNRLAQAVFLRNFKIDHGGRFIAAHLDGIDDEIRTSQRFLAVLHAEIRLQGSTSLVAVAVDVIEHHVGFLETGPRRCRKDRSRFRRGFHTS